MLDYALHGRPTAAQGPPRATRRAFSAPAGWNKGVFLHPRGPVRLYFFTANPSKWGIPAPAQDVAVPAPTDGPHHQRGPALQALASVCGLKDLPKSSIVAPEASRLNGMIL